MTKAVIMFVTPAGYINLQLESTANMSTRIPKDSLDYHLVNLEDMEEDDEDEEEDAAANDDDENNDETVNHTIVSNPPYGVRLDTGSDDQLISCPNNISGSSHFLINSDAKAFLFCKF